MLLRNNLKPKQNQEKLISYQNKLNKLKRRTLTAVEMLFWFLSFSGVCLLRYLRAIASTVIVCVYLPTEQQREQLQWAMISSNLQCNIFPPASLRQHLTLLPEWIIFSFIPAPLIDKLRTTITTAILTTTITYPMLPLNHILIPMQLLRAIAVIIPLHSW